MKRSVIKLWDGLTWTCAAPGCGQKFVSPAVCPNDEQHIRNNEYPTVGGGVGITARAERRKNRMLPRFLFMDAGEAWRIFSAWVMK